LFVKVVECRDVSIRGNGSNIGAVIIIDVIVVGNIICASLARLRLLSVWTVNF